MTAPELCVHDLDPAGCGVCNGAERRLRAESREVGVAGPVFPARYSGRCRECGARFDAGDLVRMAGEGGVVCEGCCDGRLPF